MKSPQSTWSVGIARRIITPTCEVELAGLGYYLNRTAERVRDHLTATASVIGDRNDNCVALIAMDIMYGDNSLVRSVRQQVSAKTGICPEAICINFSHSHNAPTSAAVRGVGEVNPRYVQFAIGQAVDAAIEAWRKRQPAILRVGADEVGEISFNRTRENGPVDKRLGLLRADSLDGKPLAIAFNFHCHLNASLELDFRAVSRDWSGEAIDQLEAAFPGAMAMYLQGTCGDVMVSPEFCSTKRSPEVGRRVAEAAMNAWQKSRPIAGDTLSTAVRVIKLPTRRWSLEEVMRVREEGLHRLKTGDTTDWLNGFARVIVTYPNRLPIRYGGNVEKAVAAVSKFGVDWSEAALIDLNSRPEFLETEVQAIRIGDTWLCAHGSELFTTLALEVRRRWPHQDLLTLGYSNGGIGYLPDAYDINRHSYAADQSPKFTGQFPFTQESGTVMVQGLLDILQDVA